MNWMKRLAAWVSRTSPPPCWDFSRYDYPIKKGDHCHVCGQKTDRLAYGYYVDGNPVPVWYCNECGKNPHIHKRPNAHALAEERSDDSQQRVVGGKDR